MDYNIRWHDQEQTILYAQYPENWTWKDFYAIRAHTVRLIEGKQHASRIDVIADMFGSYFPRGDVFSHIQNIIKHDLSPDGCVVIVTNNKINYRIVQMSVRMAPELNRHYRVAPSIEAAEEIIQAARSYTSDPSVIT